MKKKILALVMAAAMTLASYRLRRRGLQQRRFRCQHRFPERRLRQQCERV